MTQPNGPNNNACVITSSSVHSHLRLHFLHFTADMNNSVAGFFFYFILHFSESQNQQKQQQRKEISNSHRINRQDNEVYRS